MSRTRYDNLHDTLGRLYDRGVRRLKFLEVGSFDGHRAAALIRNWRAWQGTTGVDYWGFDLFERMTPERSRAELSKSRLPPHGREVSQRLRAVGATVTLHVGDTRETLPAQAPTLPPMDLIFLDGGHSLETIDSDWGAVSRLVGPGTIALLDDYYENRDDFGCRALVRRLAHDLAAPFAVRRLDPVDAGADGLKIRMVEVTRPGGRPA